MPPPARRPGGPGLPSNGPYNALAPGGVKEVIDYSFYDKKTLISATAAQYSYFTAAGVDPLVSNFEGQGQMPAGQAFHVRAVRIVIRPATLATALTSVIDVLNIMSFTSLLFTLENSKKMTFGPAWMYPSGYGVTSETNLGNAVPAAPANSLTRGNNGIPSAGNCYQFERPIVLRPQQPFQVSLTTSATGILLANTDVYLVLDGVLERNIL